MSRRILFLLIPLLLFAAVPTFAQARADEFVLAGLVSGTFSSHPTLHSQYATLFPFPITVQLRTDEAAAR